MGYRQLPDELPVPIVRIERLRLNRIWMSLSSVHAIPQTVPTGHHHHNLDPCLRKTAYPRVPDDLVLVHAPSELRHRILPWKQYHRFSMISDGSENGPVKGKGTPLPHQILQWISHLVDRGEGHALKEHLLPTLRQTRLSDAQGPDHVLNAHRHPTRLQNRFTAKNRMRRSVLTELHPQPLRLRIGNNDPELALDLIAMVLCPNHLSLKCQSVVRNQPVNSPNQELLHSENLKRWIR